MTGDSTGSTVNTEQRYLGSPNDRKRQLNPHLKAIRRWIRSPPSFPSPSFSTTMDTHRHRDGSSGGDGASPHRQPQSHRHQLRLSVPPRAPLHPSSSLLRHHHHPPFPTPTPSSSSSTPFPFSPSTAASTPSKLHRPPFSSSTAFSVSSLFLLLFSLRSLYSLLPFLRASPPSFSLFPFSFLVSFFSFVLTALCFLLLPSSDPPISLRGPLPRPLLRHLAAKSLLLALVFLLRFQALRSCGTAATILAEFSGALAAGSLSSGDHPYSGKGARRARKLRGFVALAVALVLLSHGWDRIGCSPLSSARFRSSPEDADGAGCIRILPMLLPFLSGFLGFYGRSSTNWLQLRQLGRRRARLLSLGLTTCLLFFPALVSFIISAGEKDVSVGNLGWSLLNTVIFGVILGGNLADDKVMPGSKGFHREFLVTFSCTLVLELFYSPHLSLPGFLFCGFLLWISVNQLASSSTIRLELGNSDTSESLYSMVMKPVHHILSERKSRKIALFLLINTAYMVVEFVAGFVSNSLGLISDACHMLFDCAALAIGLYASYISRLPANAQFNYGRGRFEVLSGYVNAVLLVLVGALIVLESFERILDPQEISTNSLLTVSIGGLVVNVVGLVFFHEEHHHAHGGGSCSHSHSESNHHCDHHHHPHHRHQEHQHHHVDVVHHHQTFGTEHRPSIFVDHGSLGVKPHDDKNHHCCSHNSHHHSHNSEHGSDCKGRKDISEHDVCHNNHQHDHRDHSHDICHDSPQHDHHDYSHHVGGRLCGNPSDVKGYLAGVNGTCMELSGNHYHGENNVDCSKGSIDENCHIHKGHQDHMNAPGSCHILDNAHSHSPQSNESLTEGKPLEKPQKHRHIDHNMEGIFLHVLADTMGSVGVVVSTLLIKYKGWLVADPASSIFISVMIISSVIPLLRNSAEILLQRIPRAHEQDIKEALDDAMRIKGICSVHNMHVWSFTNTDIVGTLHLHVSADSDRVSLRKQVSERLHEAGIKDLTIQMECI